MSRHMRAEAGTSANTFRVYSFSYLRAAACLAIVLLHTVFCAVSLFPEEASATQALLSNIVVNNMMWAVPCFLMVSGALLLNPERPVTVKKCLTKYIPRMLIALVVFCLLFRALEILVNHEPVNAETLLSGFYEIFSGTSWSHVWYLYLMIGIYLLLPFYHKIASNSTTGELRYLMIVYVIFLSLVPVLKTFGISVGFYICVSAIYPFYLFCGYALRQGVWRVNRGLGLLFLLIGTAAVVLFTVLKENGTIKAAGVFYGYSSIFVILQSIGVFTLFGCAADKTGAPRKEKSPGVFGKFVLEIDKCSFGIYLLHMIFVRGILKHTKLHPYGAGSPFVLIGLTLGIFFVSFILTWILKKIPGVKKIL